MKYGFLLACIATLSISGANAMPTPQDAPQEEISAGANLADQNSSFSLNIIDDYISVGNTSATLPTQTPSAREGQATVAVVDQASSAVQVIEEAIPTEISFREIVRLLSDHALVGEKGGGSKFIGIGEHAFAVYLDDTADWGPRVVKVLETYDSGTAVKIHYLDENLEDEVVSPVDLAGFSSLGDLEWRLGKVWNVRDQRGYVFPEARELFQKLNQMKAEGFQPEKDSELPILLLLNRNL